ILGVPAPLSPESPQIPPKRRQVHGLGHRREPPAERGAPGEGCGARGGRRGQRRLRPGGRPVQRVGPQRDVPVQRGELRGQDHLRRQPGGLHGPPGPRGQRDLAAAPGAGG
ncbi:PREDICTED: collagen alpha-1(I) chain-like, partial [Corvus brachyrhynchos]|uniref:collagen alpha-1(I) chain-like n=1 Tax=Corvus brachyrhynchos TaxID=85066 RepID=UPI000816668E